MNAKVDDDRVEAALARLRELGERITPARNAVLTVVDAADRADEHLSAEQIGERVADREPSVHRATVYRTLTSLTDAGVLSHVHLGGSATVYHLAAAHTSPAVVEPQDAHGHLHVQCSVCGRVQDAPVAVLDEAGRWLRDELGFELDTTHAALLGRCSACSSE
ncbi:transcriptional repressor [Intrasporangium calvum]|uniref:Transcriptional repressor n=1 Tax=Intrasporangium calvum TaxID=53358 RepID=A0ABT5GCL9_9MICO|nr:Fur family transcriptional regulator [Intrasporangium calvum]MDC5696027.1 transcriptional repressor [Intrasporangium calvum]